MKVVIITLNPANVPLKHERLKYFFTTIGPKNNPTKSILSKSINKDWIFSHPWVSDTPSNIPVEIQQISKAEYIRLCDMFDEIETLNTLGISNVKQIDGEIKRLKSKLNIPIFVIRPFKYAEIIKLLNSRIDRLTMLKGFFKSNQETRVIFT